MLSKYLQGLVDKANKSIAELKTGTKSAIKARC